MDDTKALNSNPSYFRLRQVCLATEDLQRAGADLSHILRLQCAHVDAALAQFGLRNAVYPVGDSFIELVQGLHPDAAAARFVARSGAARGAYMAIFNASDAEQRAQQLKRLGLTVALEIRQDDFYGIQIHPRSSRACMLEIDCTPGEADLHGTYFAAGGTGWQSAVCTEEALALPQVGFVSATPESLAQHWSAMLQLPLSPVRVNEEQVWRLEPQMCRMEFRGTDPATAPEGERLNSLTIRVRHPQDVLERARKRGYALAEPAGFEFSGVHLHFIGESDEL